MAWTALVPGGACASDTSEPADDAVMACAGYEVAGPYAAGVTTLYLDGAPVEVWYPASKDSVASLTPASYDMREWLPLAERSKISDEEAPRFEMDAYRDVAPASDGPYPLALFSHGLGGYRMQSSFLMTHLAQYGFVVVAPEHAERGLAILVETGAPSGDNSPAVLREAWQLLADTDGLLAGVAATDRVAILGHSAGGGAVLDVAKDDKVVAWLTYASGGFGSSGGPAIPSFMMVGTHDQIASAEQIEKAYERQAPGKGFLSIAGMGHLGFSDICAIGADRGGVLEIAVANGVEVPELLLTLGRDGCQEDDLPPEEGWPVINHYSTAHLLQAFGIGERADSGLASASAQCFGERVATYLHD